jgi:hypothetical protein
MEKNNALIVLMKLIFKKDYVTVVLKTIPLKKKFMKQLIQIFFLLFLYFFFNKI